MSSDSPMVCDMKRNTLPGCGFVALLVLALTTHAFAQTPRPAAVDTRPIVEAARSLLDSLDATQRRTLVYPIDSKEWRVWSNFHRSRSRVGLRLGDLKNEERTRVFGLLREALSARGLQMAQGIVKLNHVLGVLTGRTDEFNEDDYYLVMFGTPSPSEPWGFQFEGHHLVINYVVLGGEVVMSPTFWGSEPLHTPRELSLPRRYQNLSVLEAERAEAKRFMDALSDEQRAKSRLDNPGIIAGAGNDNPSIEFEGLPGKDMNERQRRALLDMIGAFVRNVRDDQARIDMAQVAAHIENTWFSAQTRADGRIFYRIISPEILVEFDEVPRLFSNEEHVHAVVRRRGGNDYGESLLQRHLHDHPH